MTASLIDQAFKKCKAEGRPALITYTVAGDPTKKKSLDILIGLMSCRVFKRTLEHSLLYSFLQEAKNRNIKIVRGKYLPTKKNKIVSNLYEEMGFLLMEENEGAKIFEINLQNFIIPTNSNIIIEKL